MCPAAAGSVARPRRAPRLSAGRLEGRQCWPGAAAFAGRAGMCSQGSRPVLPPSFFIHGNSISSHAATGILRDPGCLSSPARGSLPRTQLPWAVPAFRVCCQHPYGTPRGDTPSQPQLAPGFHRQPHTLGHTESPPLLPTPNNILGFISPPAFPPPFEKGSPGSTSQARLHPPCPKPSPGKHWSPPSISDQEHKERRGLSTPPAPLFHFRTASVSKYHRIHTVTISRPRARSRGRGGQREAPSLQPPALGPWPRRHPHGSPAPPAPQLPRPQAALRLQEGASITTVPVSKINHSGLAFVPCC